MDGWNFNSWFVTEVVFEGAVKGLFSLLFGSGFILMPNSLEKLGMDVYTRRLEWLLAFGLIYGQLR
ncbi:hypothetical protein GARC_3727 [Paraglaciecola arctica BSs20135]|uniref:Uncharacterized protein n=1 Tax=Paraglaciecola arctica BSs20135 TaxID=493475 RepID=K6Y9P7_9ALTE|nr:hypothetical protein GARC_3727 [Paraglaciecola arctica BSs20135]